MLTFSRHLLVTPLLVGVLATQSQLTLIMFGYALQLNLPVAVLAAMPLLLLAKVPQWFPQTKDFVLFGGPNANLAVGERLMLGLVRAFELNIYVTIVVFTTTMIFKLLGTAAVLIVVGSMLALLVAAWGLPIFDREDESSGPYVWDSGEGEHD